MPSKQQQADFAGQCAGVGQGDHAPPLCVALETSIGAGYDLGAGMMI
jgi:hypothetical protein